jgi:hypothetical protein
MINALDETGTHKRITKSSGQRWRSNKEKPRTPIIDMKNAKDLRRLMAEASSTDAVQPNLSRMILHDLDHIRPKDKSRAMEGWKHTELTASVYAPNMPSPADVVAFINQGGEKAVIRIYRTLRDLSAHNALSDVVSALTQAMRCGESLEGETKHAAQSFIDGFLDPILRLEAKGNTDSALDLLYDKVDELLKTGEFEKLNQILADSSPEELSIDMILGLLTSSLPARSKLPARADFFEKSEAAIKSRGEYEDGLLSGLEQ